VLVARRVDGVVGLVGVLVQVLLDGDELHARRVELLAHGHQAARERRRQHREELFNWIKVIFIVLLAPPWQRCKIDRVVSE
jgi:hypothetical protein